MPKDTKDKKENHEQASRSPAVVSVEVHEGARTPHPSGWSTTKEHYIYPTSHIRVPLNHLRSTRRSYRQEFVPGNWFGRHRILACRVCRHRTFARVASTLTSIHSCKLRPRGAVWTDDCWHECRLLR